MHFTIYIYIYIYIHTYIHRYKTSIRNQSSVRTNLKLAGGPKRPQIQFCIRFEVVQLLHCKDNYCI